MALLNAVKPRLGIYYSEENKDKEVQQMVNGAIEYFKGAGWNFTALLPDLEAKEAGLETLYEELSTLEKIEKPTSEDLALIAAMKEEIKIETAEIEEIYAQLSLPIEAITLYCKMAQPTSAFQLTNHPVLTAMIAQGRSENNADI